VLQFEDLRAQGVSLLDIGAGRANKNIDEALEEKFEEKSHTRQIEDKDGTTRQIEDS